MHDPEKSKHGAKHRQAYPELKGLNKSAIHWDIPKEMRKNGEIYADDKLFYKSGKFLT